MVAIELLGELELKDDEPLAAERHFGAGKIEFQHAAETFTMGCLSLRTPRREPLAPGINRLGVAKPQDLNVGDNETGAFDWRQDFGQGGHIAPGENIFRDPRIGRPRPIRPANGANESDLILVELLRGPPEKQIVTGEAHMFEHADRDNPVETPVEFAVIGEPEIGGPR